MRPLLLILALLAAACGGGSGDTTTSEAAAPTTTAEATTTTSDATTTTEAATTTTAESTTSTEATTTTVDTNSLASGSGCTPGTSDDLPDGTWFGYAVAATDTTVDFDLACWFSGDAAVIAAAEDGDESPPPNDYHVRNENPALRTLPVAAFVEVAALENPGDPSTVEMVPWVDWAAERAGPIFEIDGVDYYQDIWITIVAGEVVTVEEQYRP